MAAFFGNATHTLDPKGRATIPSLYRDALGSCFTIGFNSQFTALALYPKEKWDQVSESLARIPNSDARGMLYVRMIASNSFVGCDLDAQGRILLPAPLREKAGISKAIRFVGVGQYLEIWDEDRYRREMELAEESNEDLLSYVNDRYFSSDL